MEEKKKRKFSVTSTTRKQQKITTAEDIKNELLWKWKEINIPGLT
jgi:hypothetical protein